MSDDLRQLAESKGLLDYDQAATYLGTNKRHVRGLWQQRMLPAIKVGRFVRFRPQDLDAYVEAHRVEAVQ